MAAGWLGSAIGEETEHDRDDHAFEKSPDGGKGLARDTRVRWALEEAGQALRRAAGVVRRDEGTDASGGASFGQIPTYEDGDVTLFETGAIVLHIAQQGRGLLPDDPAGRAAALSWVFAALSTVEPPILDLQNAVIMERDQPWAQTRMPVVKDRIRTRLKQLAARLGRR